MPVSGGEAILSALHAALSAGLTPDVLRNEVVPQHIPACGLVIMRDGDPEEIDVTLSPLTYHYAHEVEVEVFVAATTGRDTAFDAIRREIGAVVQANRTLGDLCDWVEGRPPRTEDIPANGGTTIKASLVPIALEYGLADPLT